MPVHNATKIQTSLSEGIQCQDIQVWNEAVSSAFNSMDCISKSDAFNGSIRLGRLDSTCLAKVTGAPLEVVRSKSHIAKMSDEHYLVKCQLQGRSIVHHLGKEALLEPGDFVVCSSAEPYRLVFDEAYAQAVIVIAPAQLNELVPHLGQALGSAMSGANPVNGMFSQFVASLSLRYDHLQPQVLQRMEANAIDLLVTALEANQQPELVQVESVQAEHLKRIKQFIAMHLHDSRLSPNFIAEAEGIGTRYLHILFKKEGVSVSRYIQAKRLELIARMLTNPTMTKVSTSDIALEAGFNDISHFHRCFKVAFGVTPRKYRLSLQGDSEVSSL